ncbi:serine hydrolase domain-containing protein [Burkholderia anthina]|uniref:serine hydrolase domain-containing protein n=1 Tax=Burkholderia anthina TaxID=179879 RepID=UPI00158A04D9|nr:serine hydrolase domain-containing protein [Burkholderia anthina]
MNLSEWTDLDALIDQAMKHWSIPGMALAVIHGDDLPLIKCYGTRDIDTGAPITPQTQFMTCSLTKSMTAAGLALLIDECRLDWNTRVQEVLPEFRLLDEDASRNGPASLS